MSNIRTYRSSYKYLNFMSMLYLTLMVVANVVIYRFTQIHDITLSVGTIIIPWWYLCGDVISEVYGYKNMRRIIWGSLLCMAIFSTLVYLLINLPSFQNKALVNSYDLVLGRMPRVFSGMALAILIGTFINSYLISKWKIIILGRLFWLRSIGASGIGQILFTTIAMTVDLYGITPTAQLAKLISVAVFIKLVFTPLAVIPTSFICMLIKKLENCDIYDYTTNFNPFKFEISDDNYSGCLS